MKIEKKILKKKKWKSVLTIKRNMCINRFFTFDILFNLEIIFNQNVILQIWDEVYWLHIRSSKYFFIQTYRVQ